MFSLSPEEWVAIGLSLRIASVATLLSLPLAVATALLLARGRFPGRSLIDGVVHLPLILPPVVTGFALLLLFGRRGPIGSVLAEMGIVVAFRWTGAALAAGVMAFPLMVRAIRLSIEAIDPRLEAAAGTLGANRFWTFFWSPCRSRRRAFSSAQSSPSPRRSANSARRSPSCPTSRARRKRYRLQSTASRKRRAATSPRCGLQS
jgi:ABC-type sulfate transport system permease component